MEHTQVYRLCLIHRAPRRTRAAPEADLQGAHSTESTVRRIQLLQFTWLSCHGGRRCATSQNAWALIAIFSGQEKARAGCLSRPYFGAWQGTVPFPMFFPASFCLHSAHVQRRGKTGRLLADAVTGAPYPRLCWELSPALAWPRAAFNTDAFFLSLGHWKRSQRWWKWPCYSQMTEYYVNIKKSLEKLSNYMGKGLQYNIII